MSNRLYKYDKKYLLLMHTACNNLEQLIFSAPEQWVGASEYRKLIINDDLI
ncbi:hypothetical protein [Lactobacillus bombicola]|uniref:hypothetical protein n=1 Tax=Lactobacillus bombicola TaxID=1505723 RepID=UPI0015FC7EFA|nr:hypothetical protein [Lactobacillus bombicola]